MSLPVRFIPAAVPFWIGPWRAFAMVFATAGSIDCVHLVAGGATSLPPPSTILSIATGVQVSPLLAMPANAVAIVSGAMLFVPRTEAGLESSGAPVAV